MRKKAVFMILLICLTAAALSATALAERGPNDTACPVEGGNIWFDPATGTVTECDETVTYAAIPARINGTAVRRIGERAFYNCSALTGVSIPDGVAEIGERAFGYCGSLTGAVIPGSVQVFGDSIFFNCGALRYAVLMDGVTAVGESMFSVCESLTSVVLPPSLTEIGNNAFDRCRALTGVVIPEGVTRIGIHAFLWCNALTSVYIPSSTVEIGDGAFSSCPALENIRVDRDNPAFRTRDGVLFTADGKTLLMYPCKKPNASYTVPEGTEEIGTDAFEDCDNLRQIVLPNGVRRIGESAFYDCDALTGVSIPASTSYIGYRAFGSCSSLEEIPVDGANPAYRSVDGVLFTADGKTLHTYPIGRSDSTYTIPEGTEEIFATAFQNCGALQEVRFPGTLRIVGDMAFDYCDGLRSASLPEGLAYIGYGAFGGCTSMETVTIPASIAQIGGWAFENCMRLTDIYYTGTQAQWDAISMTGELYGDNIAPTLHISG